MAVPANLPIEIIKYLPYNIISKLCDITYICSNKLLWLRLLNLDYSTDNANILKAKYLSELYGQLELDRNRQIVHLSTREYFDFRERFQCYENKIVIEQLLILSDLASLRLLQLGNYIPSLIGVFAIYRPYAFTTAEVNYIFNQLGNIPYFVKLLKPNLIVYKEELSAGEPRLEVNNIQLTSYINYLKSINH
jgi:hypothetical protein